MELRRMMHPDDEPGARERIKSQQEEIEDELEHAIVDVLNRAVTLHVSGTRKQAHCELCNGWNDEHATNCAIPYLERWLYNRVTD